MLLKSFISNISFIASIGYLSISYNYCSLSNLENIPRPYSYLHHSDMETTF